MKHPLLDALPRWLLTWLLCVALNLGLADYLQVDSRWWLAILALLLWCGLLAVGERFGRFWAVAAIWLVTLGLCLRLSDRELLLETATALLSRGETAQGYGELLLLLLCATAALPLSALLRFYWVKLLLSLAWLAFWVTAAVLEWPLPRLIPAALIPQLLMTLAESIRRFRRDGEPSAALKRALLLSLLPAVLLLGFLPTPAEPYGYPLLHVVAEKVELLLHQAETILHYRLKGDREFGLSFNGFSDEAELGEGTEEKAPGIVFAKAKTAPDGAIYLFGNAWDHFDGRSWSSSLKEEDARLLNWKLDTAEHLYALWRMLGPEGCQTGFSDYFRPNSVYIHYRNMNIRTMFTVMDATSVYTDEERFPYQDAPVGALFDYLQQEEAWYRIYCLESNVQTRDALIAASEGTVYDSEAWVPRWSHVAEALPGLRMDLKDEVNLQRTFALRVELIQNVYLDCTGVSDRARALAEEITAGCGSDWEKAAAIGAYLRENYSYTLTPAPLPKGENMLDWLLFEGREGYCTWYASAAVLLARSVGVPARYVQGFRVEQTEDNVFTQLSTGSAHAWCECYIAGYGWVTVEATPGYAVDSVGWQPAEEPGDEEAAAAAAPTGEGPSVPEAESGEDLSETPAQAGPGGKVKPSEPEPEPEPIPEQTSLSPILLPAVLAALVAALAAVWLWLRARKKRRYAQADPSTRLLWDLERLLRDLSGKGYPRQPAESLQQYFARLPWRNLFAPEDEAKAMAALYDRTFFGQKPPSEAELARHRAFAARFRPRTPRQWLLWLGLK